MFGSLAEEVWSVGSLVICALIRLISILLLSLLDSSKERESNFNTRTVSLRPVRELRFCSGLNYLQNHDLRLGCDQVMACFGDRSAWFLESNLLVAPRSNYFASSTFGRLLGQ